MDSPPFGDDDDMVSGSASGFEGILALLNESAGEDLSSQVDVTAMQEQFVNGGSLIDWVLDNAEISEREFGDELAKRLGLTWEEDPIVDEGNSDVLKSVCPPPVAIKHRVLPLSVEFTEEGNSPSSVILAHYDPLSSLDRQLVRRAVNCPISWIS